MYNNLIKVKLAYIRVEIMANMNEKKGMLIFKNKKEIHELIEALGMSKNSLRDQLLFKLDISTGIRCGDLVALKVEQVQGKSYYKFVNVRRRRKERFI